MLLTEEEAKKREPCARMEVQGVLENVLGSMLGSMEVHMKNPEKRKRPKPEAYAKIMLEDLAVRGWELRRTTP